MNEFIEQFSYVLENLNKYKCHSYILGDFNIDLLKTNCHAPTAKFINLIFSSSFIPLINRPTRVTDTTATLIDNIFTNNLNDHALNGILTTDISDHFSVFHISKAMMLYVPMGI